VWDTVHITPKMWDKNTPMHLHCVLVMGLVPICAPSFFASDAALVFIYIRRTDY